MLIEPESLFDLLVQWGIYHLVNGDGEMKKLLLLPLRAKMREAELNCLVNRWKCADYNALVCNGNNIERNV